jgi:tetratricopeptide (TPR) repeat protein
MIRLNDEFTPPREKHLDLSEASNSVLLKVLRDGHEAEQREALGQLIVRQAENELVACLVSPNVAVSELATAGLWECWLNEEGPDARAVMERGIDLMHAGEFLAAEEVFCDLGRLFPGWAEAVNKHATVLYMRGLAEDSYDLCELVIEMKPHHFGAWHGLALCAVRLKDWETALMAAKEALHLQPHAGANKEIIRLVKRKLRKA